MMTSSYSSVNFSPSDDPQMEQAANKARHTFRFFWREMAWEKRRIVPALDLAGVKATFADPPEVRAKDSSILAAEHMWLLNVDFDGRQIHGTLINSPETLKTFKQGDELKIPAKQMCDWMYVVAGKVYGGFTIDVLRSRMSRSERRAHDQAWGFDFGEVGVVNVVPPEYLGEASAKQGLLSRLLGAKPQPQDFAAAATIEHPMSANMRASLKKMLRQNPGAIHEADDHGFTYLHQLALAGSLDGVDVCLELGADAARPASNGLTPLALAKSLGWTKVVTRLQQAGAV